MAKTKYDSLLERDLRDTLEQQGWEIVDEKRSGVNLDHGPARAVALTLFVGPDVGPDCTRTPTLGGAAGSNTADVAELGILARFAGDLVFGEMPRSV